MRAVCSYHGEHTPKFLKICVFRFCLAGCSKNIFPILIVFSNFDRIFGCGIIIDVGPIVCVDPKLASGADEKKPAYSKFE